MINEEKNNTGQTGNKKLFQARRILSDYSKYANKFPSATDQSITAIDVI